MEDMQRHREQATIPGEEVQVISAPPQPVDSGPQPAGEDAPARVLEQLHWTYMDHKGEFGQMAALEQPGIEVRDAVKAVLALPADVLTALGAVSALSGEDRRTISAAIALPADLQATLRTILG